MRSKIQETKSVRSTIRGDEKKGGKKKELWEKRHHSEMHTHMLQGTPREVARVA